MIMYLSKLNIALILLFSFYKLMFTGDTFFCGHNQSLRIKGNRGKRKECNYLK